MQAPKIICHFLNNHGIICLLSLTLLIRKDISKIIMIQQSPEVFLVRSTGDPDSSMMIKGETGWLHAWGCAMHMKSIEFIQTFCHPGLFWGQKHQIPHFQDSNNAFSRTFRVHVLQFCNTVGNTDVACCRLVNNTSKCIKVIIQYVQTRKPPSPF